MYGLLNENAGNLLRRNQLTTWSKSFQRGTLGLCWLKGCKVTSCQIWRFEENFCRQARVEPHACSPGLIPGQFDYP